MTREELRNKLTDILSVAMSGGINLTQAERSIWDLFNPGLPPAEGAEEILKNRLGNQYSILSPLGIETIIAAMHEFATLHAQRIADKMVSERLREELIRYIKWYGGFNYENMTDEMLVNEYLKSREK